MSFISDPPFDEVASRLEAAVKRVISKDSDLFNFEVNERTVTQRLALYLEQAFEPFGLGLKADCEYNRMWGESGEGEYNLTKKYPQLSGIKPSVEDSDGVTVFPDVIVHLRGKQFANVLVIEAKRNAPVDAVPDNDRIKLYEFTRMDGGFRYPWGAFLNFRSFKSPCGRDHKVVTIVDVFWFRNGEVETSTQVQLP